MTVRAGFSWEAGSRFEVLETLGEGGFGTVYRARDTATDEVVALKQLIRTSPADLQRFKREFRVLAELHHPHLVSVRELIEHAGQWFIVMDYIDGTGLREYVAPEQDAARRQGWGPVLKPFVGIARGLMALHEAGVVHRDLKPANVRITGEGRAVLLDLGLVTSANPHLQSTHQQGLGTAAYVAPEQAQRMTVDSAADWYAFGTCLFEAVAGRLPFEATTSFDMVTRKQSQRAPALAEIADNIPEDLSELCEGLLALEPDERPKGAEVLACLSRHVPSPAEEAPPPRLSLPPGASLPPDAPFEGRDRELQCLEEALGRAQAKGLSMVLIEGESGVGKTALLQHFTRSLVEREALVFSGRCHENEDVPFKAFDRPVDRLAKYLEQLPQAHLARLLPRRAALLPQLFPILQQVKAITDAPTQHFSAEPTARRLEAFAAMADLWARVAEDRCTVLTIDDLQWADRESLRLLRALVEQPLSPPMLVVATLRPRAEQHELVRADLDEIAELPCARVWPLQRLSEHDTRALAFTLLGHKSLGRVEQLARESHGHPMLLQELVHVALSDDRNPSESLTLEAALTARLDAMPGSSRELLDLLALAARPQPGRVLNRALSLQGAHGEDDPEASPRLEDRLRPLLTAKLVRRGPRQELSCAHDSIREVASRSVSSPHRARLHGQLAEALQMELDADPAELGRHWYEAGRRGRAADAYIEASRAASDGLAFSRAGDLCERALGLIDEDDPRRVELLTRRAEALACVGRSAEAAELFAQAADHERGELRLELESRRANQLLLSAQLDDGLAVARNAFAQVGVAMPLRVLPALTRFVWEWLRYALSKLLRRGDDPATRERRKLALRLLRGLHRSIPLAHTPAFMALTAQHMRIAASFDSAREISYASTIEGWLRSVLGPYERARPLLERGRRMAEEVGDTELLISQSLAEGSAHLLHWHLAEAEEHFERAHRLLSAKAASRVSELIFARFQLAAVWYMRGREDQLSERMVDWLAEARERGDHLGVYMLLGAGSAFVRHLRENDPDAALRELHEARVQMPQEPRGSTFAHVGYLLAVQTCYAYKGGAEGLAWLEEQQLSWRGDATAGGGVMRQATAMYRLMALAAAIEAEQPEGWPPLIRQASKLARSLTGSRSPATRVLAHLALAQVEALRGRTAAGVKRLAKAHRDLGDEADALSYPVLYLQGVLEGGDSGREKRERSLRRMRDKGWSDPRRAITMGMPLARVMAPDGELQLPPKR